MKKVVPCTLIISLLFWLAYAQETTTTKETNMQTIAATTPLDQAATEALQMLEKGTTEETLTPAFDLSLLNAAGRSEDEDEWDDEDEDEDEWDNEEDEDWDEDDDEFED